MRWLHIFAIAALAGLAPACRQEASPTGAAPASAPAPAQPASPPPSESASKPADASASTPATPPSSSAAAGSGAAAAAQDDEEGHEHEAPHGGALVELGEEYAHLELVLNAETGTLTAYALDGEAEQAVRLAQPAIEVTVRLPQREPLTLTLEAVASALTGEAVGDASQFAAASPVLAKVTRFEATIARATIRGREFTGVSFRYPEGSGR